MAHEINKSDIGVVDHVGIVGGRGWHGLGQPIPAGMGAVEAGDHLGILEEVTQWDLAACHPDAREAFADLQTVVRGGQDHHRVLKAFERYRSMLAPCRSHVANMRDGEAIAVVGKDYEVCQDRDLAKFMDTLSATGKVEIETCGTLNGGRKIWFLAKSEAFQIGGDTVHPYLLLSNSHDQTMAIRLTPTTIKAVCANTLHASVPRVEGDVRYLDNAAWSCKHTGDIAAKLQEAKKALAKYDEIMARNKELFDKLASVEATPEQAKELFGRAYSAWFAVADKEMLADPETRRVAKLRMDRMDEGYKAFKQRWARERVELDEDPTLWGALNAVTGWVYNDREPDYTKFKGEELKAKLAARKAANTNSNLFGDNANKALYALNLAVTMGNIAV